MMPAVVTFELTQALTAINRHRLEKTRARDIPSELENDTTIQILKKNVKGINIPHRWHFAIYEQQVKPKSRLMILYIVKTFI